MIRHEQFYINGTWVTPKSTETLDVINPANEDVCATIRLGNEADVNAAVIAADKAFKTYSQASLKERIEIFESIISEYKKRYRDMADVIIMEMGAPTTFAQEEQAAAGLAHLETALEVLKFFKFEERIGNSLVIKQPIGVCGLITPWNWPVNQIACKVAPALATGCTMILKPSEIAPLSAIVFTEIMDNAGVPAGVFNLIHGDGAGVGTILSSHSLVSMMSFTGSTRAGSLVAQNAAPTIKRVTQELGGKSANIILDDADFEEAVRRGVLAVLDNTGQSCNAPTRMLVPADKIELVGEIAVRAIDSIVIGDPLNEATTMGPLVSKAQFDKVQGLIQKGIDEGATLLCGGVGLPDGCHVGYFVKPTIFSNVSNSMTIAREEIFGPVLSIIPYQTDEEAIEIANDTPYGLAGYVQGVDRQRIENIALKIRAGNININGVSGDYFTPFGGFKQSGNGREWGPLGFDDFLEIKAISGL